jgi:hypothetical protein
VAGLGELCAERAALATGAKLAGLGEGGGGGRGGERRNAGKAEDVAAAEITATSIEAARLRHVGLLGEKYHKIIGGPRPTLAKTGQHRLKFVRSDVTEGGSYCWRKPGSILERHLNFGRCQWVFGLLNEAAHTFLDVVRLNEAVAASEKTGQAYCMLQWTHLYLGNRLQLNRRRRTSSYTSKEVTDRSGQFAFGNVRLTAKTTAR